MTGAVPAPGTLDGLTIDPGAALLPVVGLRRRGTVASPGSLTVVALAMAAVAVWALLPPGPATMADQVPAIEATGVSPATWVAISHPLQFFALSGAPLGRLPMSYEARRTADGAARQDMLTFGVFGDPTPFLALAVRRTGTRTVVALAGPLAATAPRPGGGARMPDMLVDLVRLASTSGLAVTRAGVAEAASTRLGAFAVAPLTLQRAAVALPCLGFRLDREAPVSIAGLVCGPDGRPIDRAALACVLDRIDLVAGDDALTRDFFATAGSRPQQGCAPLLQQRSAMR